MATRRNRMLRKKTKRSLKRSYKGGSREGDIIVNIIRLLGKNIINFNDKILWVNRFGGLCIQDKTNYDESEQINKYCISSDSVERHMGIEHIISKVNSIPSTTIPPEIITILESLLRYIEPQETINRLRIPTKP